MGIAIVSTLAAAIFIALYLSKSQDCKALERDNKWLREQREQTPEPVVIDDVDNQPLDKESLMAAIRYNGYMPDVDGHWITFMAQGERYSIDADLFPEMVMTKYYDLDHKEWDMDLMYKAAHQVSDDINMGKVLFPGEEEDCIAFQIAAIENKYGHFKDCLTRYIRIINESQSRMIHLYNEMDAKQQESLSLFHQLGIGAAGGKKVLS